jgi:8-oxo-dGTP diphosphatase/2-hydroxy-dATP diphosphatase
MGVIDFNWKDKSEILEVHIFKGSGVVGEITESEEMRPQWFELDKIPFDQMWQDDKHWFPLFLAGKKFRGKILFDDADNILNLKFNEYDH